MTAPGLDPVFGWPLGYDPPLPELPADRDHNPVAERERWQAALNRSTAPEGGSADPGVAASGSDGPRRLPVSPQSDARRVWVPEGGSGIPNASDPA